MYQGDAAVRVMEQGGKKDQTLDKDNETSLPMGLGEREHFKVSTEPGFYSVKSTDITRVKNQVFTKK